jgi:hypothetical protein
MKVEVSIGEAIDKFSILELKKQKIEDPLKLQEIQKELDVLNECLQYKNDFYFFYHLLMYVNEEIWNMTDVIKTMKYEEEPFLFSKLSNQIFEFNQKRFRIKNWFNILINSNIKEQKSYANNQKSIFIEDEEIFYDKIAEIHYLALEHDFITIFTNESIISIIQKIVKIPTVVYQKIEDFDSLLNNKELIYLKDFNIDKKIIEHFELPTIQYVNGGMFGDFIQSLSVINEKFYETGRKGVLYISEGFGGDKFRNGLENTYNDTYKIIKKQRYIKDYQIHNNQSFHINLNFWRFDHSLYYYSWYHKYKICFNVEWGKHKWLNNIEIDEKWKNTIVINTVNYRFPPLLNFKKLESEEFKNISKIVFVSSNYSEYQFFLEKTGLKCEFYQFKNFDNLCEIINSCQLFIGSLSAPLTIAHALHKDRVCGLMNNNGDVINKLNHIWSNIRYEI